MRGAFLAGWPAGYRGKMNRFEAVKQNGVSSGETAFCGDPRPPETAMQNGNSTGGEDRNTVGVVATPRPDGAEPRKGNAASYGDFFEYVPEAARQNGNVAGDDAAGYGDSLENVAEAVKQEGRFFEPDFTGHDPAGYGDPLEHFANRALVLPSWCLAF